MTISAQDAQAHPGGVAPPEMRPDDQHVFTADELDRAVKLALEEFARCSDSKSRREFADSQNMQVLSDLRAAPIRSACPVQRKMGIYWANEDSLEFAIDAAAAIKAGGE